MSKFVESFADCFKTKSRSSKDLACRYVSGLLSQTQRKNMERMDERLGEDPSLWRDTYEATQQFISSSNWSSDAVFAQISQRANERLGGTINSVLCIDESSNAKKGTKSVGVARQWNGRLGKEDNCQTGVYSALCSGSNVCLVGARLFLPKQWSLDPARCRQAGVPEHRIEKGHQTKIDLALELIEQAVANGIKFGCVALDAFYGRDSNLRRSMEAEGLTYCVDVPINARLFTARPAEAQRPSKIMEHTVSAGELAAKLMGNLRQEAHPIVLRQGDNGQVEATVKAMRVWEWSEDQPQPVEMWLLVRQMPDDTLKISLCNASGKTALKQLARWQAARFWVERCFQDAKSHCGMAQYQARGWLAWHHHMALVAMALLFVMRERMDEQVSEVNLTCADVVELMEWVLMRRPTEAELIGRIKKRHRKRQAAAASKRRTQRHLKQRGNLTK